MNNEEETKAERERLVEAIINHPNTFGSVDKKGRGGAILIEDIISLLVEQSDYERGYKDAKREIRIELETIIRNKLK